MTIASRLAVVATAAGALAALMTPSHAADLRGSIKDYGYTAPMPVVSHAAAGPCYVRADVGGVIASDPNGSWPVYNEVFTGDGNNNGIIDQGEVDYVPAGRSIRGESLDGTWLAEVGAGCGSGSQGFRGEITFGFRGKQDYTGEPHIYNGTLIGDPVGTTPPDIDDPIHTSLQTHTVMLNAYYDFGVIYGVVPYIGAGIGAAYHQVDEVYFTQNPNLTNRISGNEDVSLAWSLMAGFGYQISDRAILDVGYRYIDLGEARSGRVDNAGFVNPPLRFDDISAHEIKVGLRYHFGGDSRPTYFPMK